MEAGRKMDALDRRFAGRFSYLLRELGVERSTEEILGWEWNHATWKSSFDWTTPPLPYLPWVLYQPPRRSEWKRRLAGITITGGASDVAATRSGALRLLPKGSE